MTSSSGIMTIDPHTFLRRCAVILAMVMVAGCGAGEDGESDPVEITIPAGAGFSEVVDTLVAHDLIGSPGLFRAFARVRRDDRLVRSGAYVFEEGESWGEILDDLVAGRVVTSGLTIPEGFTLKQMAERIAEVTVLDPEVVLERLQAESHEDWDVPGPGLEGYLFPNTYRFASGTSLDTVIGTMVREYQSYWTPERRDRLDEIGMSEREISALASIIEAEAVRKEEMPVISAVFHNRLRIGYPLQADPTVLYALGGHRPRLLFAAIDSVADNPYNTYRNPGIPPGPIGAFGELALEAALFPHDDSEVLYFVARSDGSHIFTRSLAEHNRAINRVRNDN